MHYFGVPEHTWSMKAFKILIEWLRDFLAQNFWMVVNRIGFDEIGFEFSDEPFKVIGQSGQTLFFVKMISDISKSSGGKEPKSKSLKS